MFLTKTWLDQDNSAAVLIESVPPSFSFMSEARMHKTRGGVTILSDYSLQCKKISYGHLASFEKCVSSVEFFFSSYVHRLPKYYATFSDDFAELLSLICIDFDFVVTVD